MSYDRRTQEASATSTVLSFLRHAQEEFLGEVLTLLKANRYVETVKVTKGVGSSFLEFSGSDGGENSFDGFLSVIPTGGTDALVTLDVDTVYRGKIKFGKNYKIGLLDVRTAANIVLDNLGIND